ncbi:uncharacterized protein LACBIDRAFT_332365 [Laccaria bicolor S238N-H82]|uniref:Predicted protein n=1 Tax=Laccaria bicolor (strain S238N-H82 / ATCC MYA-4686) TaxID=486041 RepID=B0DSH9_LACBS|nr:uncharacterized protein LACBIDRAFT_332365 [Laccaria bicolor S238N-H82]EDR02477.1 predicted protein [Laccaria bicolor S238N-H82]|eukprot:XP_001886840.1 predicted protein [Laccaria bicolor S238N-H82]
MSIPHNALPAAVKLRESALTAFKTYQDMKEGLNSAAAPTILGVAANYCDIRWYTVDGKVNRKFVLYEPQMYVLGTSSSDESANSLLIDNPLYREILARAHAAVTNRMPAYPTLAYFKQQEVDLRERVLLSMQRLDLELRLRDVLVADYEIALAQIAEREVTKE